MSFYTSFGNQAINSHRTQLTNSVGMVAGLIFNGRVSPRIEVKHIRSNEFFQVVFLCLNFGFHIEVGELRQDPQQARITEN